MIEIRLHGRGGQGLVKASHMAVASVVESGDYAHFIPSFGVERKGSPVFGYLRVSKEPIRRKTQIYHPDILVILDDTLIHLPETYDGLKKGGIVVINSTKKPEELNLPEGTGKVAVVDATKICLESFGRFIPNTAMLGALCKVTDYFDKEMLFRHIVEMFGESNLKAAQESYDSVVCYEL